VWADVQRGCEQGETSVDNSREIVGAYYGTSMLESVPDEPKRRFEQLQRFAKYLGIPCTEGKTP
jgi:hypothetical protein